MQRFSVGLSALAVTAVALALAAVAFGHAPSGAIFTTVADGSEVNFNHYPSKQAVYLDGGPGPGAPQTAAGLDDGSYVFQVTNPNGKVLLSTDPARCRQFTVADGIIDAVVDTDCEHVTGFDIDHGAKTVQLFPYLDTPNPGGVYKVWAVRLDDFLLGCNALGVGNGLNVVDCGDASGNHHGFIPSHSKTDNFKVKDTTVIEIDTHFIKNGERTDGLAVKWTDPLGATNKKWSYYAPELQVIHEAHVEAAEVGTHTITVDDQAGCAVREISFAGKTTWGPGAVSVPIKNDNRDKTYYINVVCH